MFRFLLSKRGWWSQLGQICHFSIKNNNNNKARCVLEGSSSSSLLFQFTCLPPQSQSQSQSQSLTLLCLERNPTFSQTQFIQRHYYHHTMIDARSKFLEVYSLLKSELLNDPAFEFTDNSRQWVERMLDYNVPGGKLNRGLSVIDSYKLLKEGKELTDDEVFLACVLGWCIEWLQAYFLVLDDIMDGSQTRRGQPCWFRLPKVGLIAINDGLMLRNHITRILKKHFRGKPYYADLLDLFTEVEFQTTSGQMIDLITTLEGEQDLSKYSLDLHRRIVQYKTAYYSFYLPVACALLISGKKLEAYIDVKNILIDMGIYFQVQDDYLDCYGHPEVIGKIGTDIQDFKCSWLVVKAMELSNEEQKKKLIENYGKEDPDCEAKVKELYRDLDLENVFLDYESESYAKLIKSIEAHPSIAVQAVLKSFLGKIYKRQK